MSPNINLSDSGSLVVFFDIQILKVAETLLKSAQLVKRLVRRLQVSNI